MSETTAPCPTPDTCPECGRPIRWIDEGVTNGRHVWHVEPIPTPSPDPLTALDSPELLETLADIEHERWTGWEDYRELAADGVHAKSGEPMLARWRRLRATAYENLTETEKESDRIEARKGLAAIKAYLAARAAVGREGGTG